MRKLRWIETAEQHTLSARIWITPFVDPASQQYGFATAATEIDLAPVEAWCKQHDCGTRYSSDTFCFRNEQEITMFLLRWS